MRRGLTAEEEGRHDERGNKPSKAKHARAGAAFDPDAREPECRARAQEARAATGTLRGAISATVPDGQSYNIPGATLKLSGASQDAKFLSASADDAGGYEFAGLTPGAYTLEASVEGFKTASKPVAVRAGETSVENISLEVADVSESVTVTSGADGVETTEAAPATKVTRGTLQTVPLANERFLDALPLVPGVVRGPDGQINVKGARSSQSGLVVNSSNVTDPVTGEYAINLPVEAVESLQVITNPYAPEYGNMTAGVTEVETRSGTDKWQFQVQNFFRACGAAADTLPASNRSRRASPSAARS